MILCLKNIDAMVRMKTCQRVVHAYLNYTDLLHVQSANAMAMFVRYYNIRDIKYSRVRNDLCKFNEFTCNVPE